MRASKTEGSTKNVVIKCSSQLGFGSMHVISKKKKLSDSPIEELLAIIAEGYTKNVFGWDS